MKKRIYLMVLVLGAILLTWCNSQKNETSQFLESYKTLSETYKTDIELNQCMSSSLNKCMSTIVIAKATKTMDESLCDDLMNEELKSECVWSIKLIQAIQEKDVDGCEWLTGKLFYNCEFDIYTMQAREQLDPSICTNIQPEQLWEADEYVNYIYEEARKNCNNDVLIATAKQKLDPSICEGIDDASVQNICREELVFTQERLAEEKENAEITDVPKSEFEDIQENPQ